MDFRAGRRKGEQRAVAHPHHGPSSLSILPVNGPSLTPHPSIHIEPSVRPFVHQSINQADNHTNTDWQCCRSMKKKERAGEEESRAWVEVEGKDNSNSNFQSHPIHHLSIHQFDGVLPSFCCWMALPGRLPHRCRSSSSCL